MNRIFLSHKSTDKAKVRDYKQTLELVGLSPWIDEDDMPAGTELHRAIQAGIKSSCAAVFFVTPQYVDEKHIRAEINYAIDEKTRRGDDFSIVTLVFPDDEGQVGPVPELLQTYVWKQPKTDLQGLSEIIRALPAAFRDIKPRGATEANPKVRMSIASGKIVYQNNIFPPSPVVTIRIENHGKEPIYISNGISFERDDTPDLLWTGFDANGLALVKRSVNAGDAYSVSLKKTWFVEHATHIKSAFFVDEIGRVFKTDEQTTRKALENV